MSHRTLIKQVTWSQHMEGMLSRVTSPPVHDTACIHICDPPRQSQSQLMIYWSTATLLIWRTRFKHTSAHLLQPPIRFYQRRSCSELRCNARPSANHVNVYVKYLSFQPVHSLQTKINPAPHNDGKGYKAISKQFQCHWPQYRASSISTSCCTL